MDFFKGFDRNQLVMIDFEANVEYNFRARLVDWFVDALQIEEFPKNMIF